MKILTLLFLVVCLCSVGYGKTVKLEMLKPAVRVSDGVKTSNDLLSLSKKLKDLHEPYSCVFAVRQLNRWLHLNNTKEFIIKYTSQLCNRISHQIYSMPAPAARKLCQVKIRNYVDKIFTFIDRGDSPEQVCHEMVSVKKSQQEADRQRFPDSPTIGPFPGDKNSTLCGACEYLFTIIDTAIVKPQKLQSIVNNFKMQVCEVLPFQESQECTYFANNDLIYIIEAFAHLPTRVLCFLLLDICVGPTGQEQAKLLQQIDSTLPNRCMLGPIYACYNQEFAQRCNVKDKCDKMAYGRY